MAYRYYCPPDDNGSEDFSSLEIKFCVHPKNYIFTAAHLFHENFTEIKIQKFDDKNFRSSKNGYVRLVKKNDSRDIALLKAEIAREEDENALSCDSFRGLKLYVEQEVLILKHGYIRRSAER